MNAKAARILCLQTELDLASALRALEMELPFEHGHMLGLLKTAAERAADSARNHALEMHDSGAPFGSLACNTAATKAREAAYLVQVMRDSKAAGHSEGIILATEFLSEELSARGFATAQALYENRLAAFEKERAKQLAEE